MKVLAAIANYGTKNQAYLANLLDEYRSMPYEVQSVVLSNVPKELGPDVEVAVGLPSKDPWSLPFAHKQIFADRVDDYDLFIYSEDDTLIQQRHIDAFLEVTNVLPADRIVGFLRYEEDADGQKYCSTMHSFYHWMPGSVESFGPYTFAYFTNEHSASYMLTQDQLRRAIASGGFLVPPHHGRYDLLCTAATDPYTQCGFKKLICISRIEDFLLHHLPNQYLGRMGLPYDQMRAQAKALSRCLEDRQACAELLPSPVGLNTCRWSKRYYGRADESVLAAVPDNAQSILSVGCGDGMTEASLIARGARVVGIPLDAVMAELATAKGVELTSPDLKKAAESLRGQRFDCILLVDVLPHAPEPPALLATVVELLAEGGRLIITAPNFGYLKYRLSDPDGRRMWRSPDPFERFHLHRTTPRMLAQWLRAVGLQTRRFGNEEDARFGWLVKASCGLAGPYLLRNMSITADRGGK